MNRIVDCLARLREQGKKALITYIVNGDPRLDATLPSMHALVEAGADIIELGIAFSDPMAEGPVIQRGHERALANGSTLQSALALVSEFRQTNQSTPIVLMGYANPIERMGYECFAERAQQAGVDGVLTVDFPPEEARELNAILKQHQLENVFLLAPTTTMDRIGEITAMASGFIYYVSLKGVTGAGHLDTQAVAEKLEQIRTKTDLPLAVGFGIKDPESARAVAEIADAVVVGSVLVDAMGNMAQSASGEIAAAVSALVRDIKDAIDSHS